MRPSHISTLSGVFLLWAVLGGCFSPPPIVEPTETEDSGLGSAPDRRGSVYIRNTSGEDLVLFINGRAHKRIPGNYPGAFRIYITKELFAERYDLVLLSIYPAEFFSGDDYALTADIDSKSLVKMFIKDGDYVDFMVTGEAVRDILGF